MCHRLAEAGPLLGVQRRNLHDDPRGLLHARRQLNRCGLRRPRPHRLRGRRDAWPEVHIRGGRRNLRDPGHGPRHRLLGQGREWGGAPGLEQLRHRRLLRRCGGHRREAHLGVRRRGARLLRGRDLRLLLGQGGLGRARGRRRPVIHPGQPRPGRHRLRDPHRGRRRDRCLLRGHQAELSEHELEDRLLGGGELRPDGLRGPARPDHGTRVGRQAGRVLRGLPRRVSTEHG